MSAEIITKFNTEAVQAIFSNNHKVDYRELELDRIHCPTPSSRQIPGKSANQSYMGSNVEYQINDLDTEKPDYVELRLEGPPMHARSGIGELVDDTGSKSYAIYTPLDPKDDELMYFKTEVLDGIHDVMCGYAAKYASYIGKTGNYNKSVALGSIPLLYKYPKDKITKQTLMDKTPFLSNKVNIVGDNATIFIDLEKKIIPWRKLVGMEMLYVPLYKLGLYSGGGGAVITFPIKMAECVVIWYKPRIVTSSQSDTVDRYKEKYLEEYKKSLEVLSTHGNIPSKSTESENTLGIVDRTNESTKTEEKKSSPVKEEARVETRAKPPVKRGLREAK